MFESNETSVGCLLSIIIPYHNDRKGIWRLLSSIPENEGIEVIVINDNSDPIDDIIADSNIKNLKYIVQDKNKRWAGAARNKGLSVASGRYILFADSDDYFLKGFLSVIRAYLESELDIIYFKPKSTYNDGTIAPRANKYIELVNRHFSGDDSIRFEFFVPWSKLIRREFLISNNIKFDEIIASNDVIFSLRSGAESKNYEVSKKEIYCVIESKDSLTKKKSREVFDSRFDVYCRYNEYLRKNHEERRLLSAISCLSRAKHLGAKYFFSTLIEVIRNGYPILPDIHGLKRWMRNF